MPWYPTQMPYFFWCAHCSKQSESQYTCTECGEDRQDKVWPLWQRATNPDPTKKYADGKCGWENKVRKARKKKEDLDW